MKSKRMELAGGAPCTTAASRPGDGGTGSPDLGTADVRAWLVRGYALLPERRFAEARACFREAGRMVPSSVVPPVLEATVLLCEGALGEALRRLRALGRRHGDLPLLVLHEAEVLVRMGRTAAAQRALARLDGREVTEEEARFAASLSEALALLAARGDRPSFSPGHP